MPIFYIQNNIDTLIHLVAIKPVSNSRTLKNKVVITSAKLISDMNCQGIKSSNQARNLMELSPHACNV